jgi:hypothetical protein
MARGIVCVAHRCVPNGKLKHSVEHHASVAAVTPIEAEHELVEAVGIASKPSLKLAE